MQWVGLNKTLSVFEKIYAQIVRQDYGRNAFFKFNDIFDGRKRFLPEVSLYRWSHTTHQLLSFKYVYKKRDRL
ncbi:hypothetical protein LMG28614_06943 [Paraburkholderia ultramafica]|uniref:Uncharacterized protein n=1 Tax=Paraburkholderia ultramafica TaxID=1544867 RepID=A0A6S7BQH8_9BURK|nr:hypothetical protein LMG28614_06943 [Paraburkholderia ultramafica]